MSNIILDQTPPFAAKTDLNAVPAGLENKYLSAAEVNFLRQLTLDAQAAFNNGKRLTFDSQGSMPVGSAGQVVLTNLNGVPSTSVSGRAFKPGWSGDVLARAASAGATWTPNLHEHTHAEITGDADMTLNVPTVDEGANTIGGVRLEVKYTQDSTGYRALALHASIVGGSRFMARQGPGQVSTLVLKKTAAGVWYLHSFDGIDTNKELQVEDFGAKGTASSITDTTVDDTAAIQAAVDTVLYKNVHRTVRLGFRHRTTKTIQLGWGDFGRMGLVLKGSGVDYRGEGRNGSSILCDFSNAPGIAFNSAYNFQIQDFALVGKLRTWVEAKNLCNNTSDGEDAPLVDDTDGANWVDPSLDANQDSRYAPYCGIAQDAYKGTQPGTHYPDRVYPSYTGLSAQYGAAISTNNSVKNVHVIGFNTGIVLTPANSDGNGDFFSVENSMIEMCKYGLSVSHTQSRNVHLSRVTFNQCFVAFTNSTHGVQAGKIGGCWTDVSVTRVINLFTLGSTASAGPLTLLNFYAENLWRLGDYTEPTSNALTMHFLDCQFLMGLQQDTNRGCPATMVGPGNQPVGLRFTDCSFFSFPSVLYFDAPDAQFDRCHFLSATRSASVANPYQAFANNLLCGGLVLNGLNGKGVKNTKMVSYNVASLASAGDVIVGEDFSACERTTCTPLYARTCMPQQGSYRDGLLNPQFRGVAWDKSSGGGAFDSISVSGIELTLVISSGYAAYSHQWGMEPGDVWLDAGSGTVFFVRSRTSNTVIGVAQNNFKAGALIASVNTTTGYLYAACSRFYSPARAYFGDYSGASSTVSNVQWPNSYNGALSSEMGVGDRLFVDDNGIEFPLFGSAPKITAFGTGTFTLDATPNYTQAKKRIPWLLRAPPSNV